MSASNPRCLCALLGALFLASSSGCASSTLQPEFADSTDQASYAKRHPTRLQSTLSLLESQLNLAASVSAEFTGFPPELKNPDWAAALAVVERADVEGRSPHYAESLESNGQVARFYEEEKAEIHKRVGGGVQYQAKEKGCSADLYSTSVYALDKAMERQLEERTHGQSEAHAYLELNQEKIGKSNAEKLGAQADRIALASYLTHVGLVKTKNELDALIAHASSIEGTLDESIEALSEPQQAKPSKAEQAARDKELEQLKEAKALLAAELPKARQAAEGAEQRILQARQKYREAFDALKQSLEQEQRAQAQTSETS